MARPKSKKPIKSSSIKFMTYKKKKEDFLKKTKKEKTKMGRVLNKAIDTYLENKDKNKENKK